ncbi:MAG TPA: transporter substrate-binding domain-containing protein [Steroidobacteraceae bacterium]|nr:transporter substrate-binding domain-containing protein [Steroidobacteraceae bacterium]
MKSSDAARIPAAAALLLWGALAGPGTIRADDAAPADSLAALRDRGTIEIAVYADFPPYSYGKTPADAQGIDVDIAHAIADKLGLKLKLRMISAGESVTDDLRNHVWKGHYLGVGVADVMLHVGYDVAFAEREKNVFLFEPYFHDVVALAYLPNRIKNVESPLALTEHRIAVEGDTISDRIMSSEHGGALRNSMVRERSLESAVAAFKAGEVDGIMGPEGELQGLLAAQRVSGVLFRVQQPVGQLRSAWDIGVAVKNTASTALRDAVENILDTLKDDGSMQRLFAAYGVKYLDASSATAGRQVARDAN